MIECERNEDIKEDISEDLIPNPRKCYITMGDCGRASLRREDWEKVKSGLGFLDSCPVMDATSIWSYERGREGRAVVLAKRIYGLMSEGTDLIEEGSRCGGF